jgi:hypothetical protein
MSLHVIHGVLGGETNAPTPATLIVFEWGFFPNCSHRFRQVDIEIIFAAQGDRLGQLIPGTNMASYTPQVDTVAPACPIKSFKSNGRDSTE